MKNDTIPCLPEAAVAALRNDGKIAAIKIIREHTGLGLKEAKDQLEAYIAAHPELQPPPYGSKERSLFGWLFAVVLALIAIWYFWPRT
jgi:hypothetical protein